MNENKMGNTLHAFIKSTLIKSLQKCHTQNYHPTSLRKRIGGWEVCLKITLLNLRQNWVIHIEKGAPITLLKLLQYWAICIGNIVY